MTKIWTLSKEKHPIQLPYIISENLSSYKEKVELGQWELPNFKDCCPLCEGSDCPKRIGYYDRGVTEESGERYRIKIARYLCRRKGPKEPLHHTFSLLPYQLIPYLSHTLELTVDTVSFWLEGHTIEEVQGYVGDLGQEEFLDMGISTLYGLKEIAEEAFDKAMIQGDYRAEVEGGLEGFIEGGKDFHYQLEEEVLVGPLAISLDYYYRSGGYFLFGTPSQQRACPERSEGIKMTPWERQRKNFFSDTPTQISPLGGDLVISIPTITKNHFLEEGRDYGGEEKRGDSHLEVRDNRSQIARAGQGPDGVLPPYLPENTGSAPLGPQAL